MTSRRSREAPSTAVSEAGDYTNITASTLVRTGPGKLLGIFVASATSATIKVWDNTSAATTVFVGTFIPLAGQFYAMPGRFQTGCYVEVTGTLDATVFWEPRQD